MLSAGSGSRAVASELPAEDSNGEKQQERGGNACNEELPVPPIPLVWYLRRGFAVNRFFVSRYGRSGVI
jgi:hypothetical protein